MSELDPALLAALLDTLIPADARRGMPGAGTLGLEPGVAAALDDEQRAAVATLAGLESLALPERSERVRAFDETSPGLVPALHYHAMTQYYHHPDVVSALGIEAHPPFPTGFTLDPGDLSALERVRARGPRYREP